MKLISSTLLDELSAKASTAVRRRAHHNVHETPEDCVQRLFVVAQPDSYIRPHRHRYRSEFALVVRGSIDLLMFDDESRLTQRLTIGANAALLGFEIPALTWHGVLINEPGTVFFEVKQGPYDPQSAAEFAPWTPAEGALECAAYLAQLRVLQPNL